MPNPNDAYTPDDCIYNIASKNANLLDADTPDYCSSKIASGNTNIIDTDTPDNCNNRFDISKSNTNIQKKRMELINRINRCQ